MMTKLYSVEQIRALETLMMDKIPAWELMQLAGNRVYRFIRDNFAKIRHVICLVGGGNNGGDALVVAALLRQAGESVQVRMLVDADTLTGCAAKAFALANAAAVDIQPFDHQATADVTDVIVDGILGIGLSTPCREPALGAINWINQQSAQVVAIDLPSGLNADTGCVMGGAVRADHTISMIGAKLGLYTADGPDHAGQIHIASLGLEQFDNPMKPVANTLALYEHTLLPRKQNTHKGNYGHVLVVGGNEGMAGAAAMAGLSALRTGAGLVSLVVRRVNMPAILPIVPEAMVYGIDQPIIPSDLLVRASFIVVGPGLGHDQWAKACFEQVIAAEKPVLVDAQGLTFLPEYVQSLPEQMVMTPHPGEAASLLKQDTSAIQADRLGSIDRIQQRYGGVCVLKGRGTLISDGQSRYLCQQGNPGMATAGMGDVLSGIIAALVAQGAGIGFASRCGVLLHAMAGDEAAKRLGEASMLARDLIDCLPVSIQKLTSREQ